MYSVWLSDEQQRVWRDYLTMTQRLATAMNRQLQQDCGLSLADYDVLVALQEQPGCRISDLGARLGWEQSRLSHQLSRMRSRGLVARSASTDDRRAATIALTDEGRAALDSAAPGHAQLVHDVVFAHLRATDLRTVQRWTSDVLGRLDDAPSERAR
jgi:DNA-binding MarR family transcriptional regulator